MLTSYYTFAFLAAELNARLTGKTVIGAFTQDRDQLVMNITDTPPLVISCRPGLNTLFLHPGFIRAKRNTADLLPDLAGRTITMIGIDPDDRIVCCTLDNSLQLEVWFYGASANVYLLSEAGAVIDAFRKIPKPDRVARGRGSASPLPVDTLNGHSPDKAVSILKTIHPAWGTLLATEALFRASVQPDIPWNEVTTEQKRHVARSVDGMLHDLKNPAARLYESKRGITFSIIPLRQFRGVTETRFNDIHEAIRSLIARTHAVKRTGDQHEGLRRDLQALLEKDTRALARVRQDLSSADRRDEFSRYGTLLLNNLPALSKGERFAEISDGGETIRIPLLPELLPTANAQRYFDKSKRASEARKLLSTRRDDLNKRISRVDALLDLLGRDGSEDELRLFLSEHADELQLLGVRKIPGGTPPPPFRIFRVEGGFEVWAGKNSRSNDELTLRHTKPEDLWFHARGAGGSHVVLKVASAKGEPGKRAKTQAASIAAYYSKMKNAGMVPVAMTKKKYVRKPKGAPPGTVVIQREEVILATPALPDPKTSEGRQ